MSASLHGRLPFLQGFVTRPPSPALGAYVQRFWWMEGDGSQVYDEQMLHPDGGSGLIFNFADPLRFDGIPRGRRALIAGPQIASTRLQLPSDAVTSQNCQPWLPLILSHTLSPFFGPPSIFSRL